MEDDIKIILFQGGHSFRRFVGGILGDEVYQFHCKGQFRSSAMN